MNPSSFKDRFSLDFLSPHSGNSGNAAQNLNSLFPQGIDAAVDAVGGQLLSNMKAAPGQTIELVDLAKASSTRLDVVFPVVQHLASKGLVERILEDPSGNDTYRVTPAGEMTRS